MLMYHQWLELPISTRTKIADAFGIIKKGSTEVHSNVIKSDGYKIKDIETALNVEALQNYLDTEIVDMTVLWTMLIDKVEGKVMQGNIIQVGKPTTVGVAGFKKTFGRPKGSRKINGKWVYPNETK